MSLGSNRPLRLEAFDHTEPRAWPGFRLCRAFSAGTAIGIDGARLAAGPDELARTNALQLSPLTFG